MSYCPTFRPFQMVALVLVIINMFIFIFLRIVNVVNGSRKNYKLFLSNELVISKKAENGSCLICE